MLECGKSLSPVTLAYETYGELNTAGDNAILIVHGFTADAHAAGVDAQTSKVGWWDDMIGPGKPFDTDLFFVVSSNVVGGCSGSTGPSSPNPCTGRPFGIAFPRITVADMVSAQYLLLRALGVTSLATVSGSSMGGQQALQWMVSYPEYVRSAIPIACSARLCAMALALCEVSRCAILADPHFNLGEYYGKPAPDFGLGTRSHGGAPYLRCARFPRRGISGGRSSAKLPTTGMKATSAFNVTFVQRASSSSNASMPTRSFAYRGPSKTSI